MNVFALVNESIKNYREIRPLGSNYCLKLTQLEPIGEFLIKINNAIAQLPPQCKLVFKLVKEDGLKYKEVAEILNISVKNVEYHMGNSLKKIANTISVDKKTFIRGNFKTILSN